jgi:hypothetical protein
VFTVPLGSVAEVGAMASGIGLTVTTAETWGFGASCAVAVMVTVPPVGGTDGASKVVAVPLTVWAAVNEPQVPVQVTVQSTPPLLASFETVAFTLRVPPAVTLVGADGVNAMLSVLTTIEKPVTVVCCPSPSVRVTLKFRVVAVVGVPVIAPVLALSESESLSAGVVLHTSVPYPDPRRVKLYATFTVADGTCAGVVVITGGAGLFTVIMKTPGADVWPNASLTVKVMGTACFVAGVPETTPVDVLSDSPSTGRPLVALHLSVPEPEAWKVKEYAVPTVAAAAVTCT